MSIIHVLTGKELTAHCRAEFGVKRLPKETDEALRARTTGHVKREWDKMMADARARHKTTMAMLARIEADKELEG